MADCIDDIINGKSRIVLMGDYNNKYLDEKDEQLPETVFLPYDLAQANKTTHTHIQHNSGTLIDYIFTDLSFECSETVIFEIPIKSKHLTMVLICNKNIKKSQFYHLKSILKEHYDKDSAKLRELNWNVLYTMKSPDEMMFLFHSMVSKIIDHCAPSKTIFIRKNKLNVKLKSDAITKKMFASTTLELEK